MPTVRTLKTGVSGIRGVVGESFTPQLLVGFAQAFGTYLDGGTVVVGRDTRPSGEMARNALIGGLLATGCDVLDLGIAPVPTIQHTVRRVGASGGIAITASHNPQEWNALKFIHRDGVMLRPYQAEELLAVYYQANYTLVGSGRLGKLESDPGAARKHLDEILDLVGPDKELIAKRRFRVVVDCCNGAAAGLTQPFLRSLGCEVIAINNSRDRGFPRPPEPVPQHLGQLEAAVREHGADIGFAQDADADRLAIVTEAGVALGEDFALVFACDATDPSEPGPFVTTLSTSRMIDEIGERQGRQVLRTPVGEINVVEAMRRHNAALGGEGSGGVIWPRLQLCRDSFAGMALILRGLARRGGTVTEWKDSFRPGAVVRARVDCSAAEAQSVMMALREAYSGEQVDLTEGLRVVWPDGSWLHVRPSNTEAIIRVVAEADDESAAQALRDQALEAIAAHRGR
ncbi:MAG: phosphoglucosamine mutase [Armatimonadetes bacterium]|nr:phosphoglucosamine mutase [Armatimonadota bacterium]